MTSLSCVGLRVQFATSPLDAAKIYTLTAPLMNFSPVLLSGFLWAGLKSCLDDATEHCHSPNTKNNYSALASVVRPLHRKELSLPYIFCYRVQFASYLRLRHVNAYYLVAIIYKTAWSSIQVVAVFDSWEVAAFLWVGVVSALTVDTPPAFESRECSLF